MRPGGLARIVIPIPSLFESIGCEPTKVLRSGDIVLLLKHEPTRWHWPCWQVIYEGQLGIIADRWLRDIEKEVELVYLDECEETEDGEQDYHNHQREG